MPPLSYESSAPVTLDFHFDETYLKTPAKSVKPTKKSVSFNKTAEVHEIIHVNNYTDDEIDAAFYSDSDYQMMKADIRFTVHLMVSNSLQDDDDTYCRRGLEHHAPEGARRRKFNREMAFCAVLDEQDFQWEQEMHDSESIAEIYALETVHCQSVAHTIALEDQEAAKR